MVFKVYYQESEKVTPKREDTHSLYVEAETEVDARALVEGNTEYNIEFVEPVTGDFLDYEKQNPSFQLTEFK